MRMTPESWKSSSPNAISTSTISFPPSVSDLPPRSGGNARPSKSATPTLLSGQPPLATHSQYGSRVLENAPFQVALFAVGAAGLFWKSRAKGEAYSTCIPCGRLLLQAPVALAAQPSHGLPA